MDMNTDKFDGAGSAEPDGGTDATSSDPLLSRGDVEEKRKMWQIFTDDNGDVQRKSFPISDHSTPNKYDANSDKSNHIPYKSDQTNLVDKSEQNGQLSKDQVNVIVSPLDANDASLFGSLDGFANPNAVDVTQLANGDIVVPPPKPPRRVEIIPKSPGQVADTVVFQADTTYSRFDTVGVDSEDEELFGDSTRTGNPAEEHHYVGNKVLIRSESDLDILLTPPTKRIWLFNSKYCCVDLYKWPLLRTYLKVLCVGIGMTLVYVVIVLIIVYTMG